MSIRYKLSSPPKEDIKSEEKISSSASIKEILFEIAHKEFKEISEKIKKGEIRNIKDCKLVKARIATKANVDRSTITLRRQPELYSWIETKNRELEQLCSQYKPLKRYQQKDKSKDEMLDEISSLKSKLTERLNQERRDIVEKFFESNLLEDRNSLHRMNSRLRVENEELQDKVTRLQSSLYEKESYIASLTDLLTDEQRSMLGKIKVVRKRNN